MRFKYICVTYFVLIVQLTSGSLKTKLLYRECDFTKSYVPLLEDVRFVQQTKAV